METVAESALYFETHHREQVGVCGAKAVQQNDGVGDGGVGIDVVHPHKDAVVLAVHGLARVGSEDGVDDRAVGVVDDTHGVGRGGGGYVGRLRDLACRRNGNVGAIHVFVQWSSVCERDAGGGNRGPESGCCIDHGGGLLVGYCAIQRTLIDVVIHVAAGPVNGLA
jgi:hypothetical protein